MYYGNGDKHEGEWRDDLKNGKGTSQASVGFAYYRNGDKYEGEWQDGKIVGKGNFKEHARRLYPHQRRRIRRRLRRREKGGQRYGLGTKL